MKHIFAPIQGPMLLDPSGISALDALGSDKTAILDRYEAAIDKPEHCAYSVTSSGVAVIRVEGLLVHRLGIDGPFWGMTGYDGIERQIKQANSDPNVRSILLDIDSPGGMVSGAIECARVISESGKPVTSLVNEMAASAAYWIACASDEIVAMDGANVGSIGVIMVHAEYSEALQNSGVKHTIIKSGKFKDTGSPVRALTGEEAEKWQAEIDVLAGRFFEWVSSRRGMSVDEVRDLEADVFSASEAGQLIDRISNKDEILDDQANIGTVSFADNGGSNMADTNDRAKAVDLEKQVADLTEKLEASASSAEADKQASIQEAVAAALAEKAQADAADKARVDGILGLDEAKGREAVARKLADKQMSVEDAKDVLAAMPTSYVREMDEAGGAGIEATVEVKTPSEPKENVTVMGM